MTGSDLLLVVDSEMVLSVYPPYPAFAALAAVLCAVFAYLFIRERRDPGRRMLAIASLVLALVFAVATGGFVVASYQEYVQMNTWTYLYELDVLPNATSTQAVIVPVPEDASLLADLHLEAGYANWSFTDTVHGRGLYVQFGGPATLVSTFSEFASSGVNWNVALTMTNSSAQAYGGRVWVYYTGGGGVRLHLQPGGQVTNDMPTVVPGWNLIELIGIPNPP